MIGRSRVMQQKRIAIKRSYLSGMLLIAPILTILVIMMLIPMIRTFQYSVSKIEFPALKTSYIGLGNFRRVFSLGYFGTVIYNTVIWILFSVISRFALGFLAALLLQSSRKAVKVIRVLVLLPWTTPSIVSANTWKWMFQADMGFINNFLKSIGLSTWAHNWLGSPTTAMGSVLLAYTWAGYPFVMMMLLAGLQSISEELYDAGKIDGANTWQLFLHITLPELKPVIISVLILEITSGLNSFDLLFTMTGGGPGGSTEILGLLIHRLGFTNFDFAGASAVSVFVMSVAVIVFLISRPLKGIQRGKRKAYDRQ